MTEWDKLWEDVELNYKDEIIWTSSKLSDIKAEGDKLQTSCNELVENVAEHVLGIVEREQKLEAIRDIANNCGKRACPEMLKIVGVLDK